MPATTVKVSTATRDRLKSCSRGTADDTINAALDALERVTFWEQADRAARARRSLSPEVLKQLERQEGDLDRTFEGIG